MPPPLADTSLSRTHSPSLSPLSPRFPCSPPIPRPPPPAPVPNQVSAGTLKFSLAVSDWPFCDPTTAPTRSTQDTPSTVCAGASSALETGAFLDAKLVVRGPSSSKPVLSAEQTSGGEGEGGEADVAGLEYGMSGGSAEAWLIMSEWVKTDSNGWTKVGAPGCIQAGLSVDGFLCSGRSVSGTARGSGKSVARV